MPCCQLRPGGRRYKGSLRRPTPTVYQELTIMALHVTQVIDVFCPHFKRSIPSCPLRVLQGTVLTPRGPTDGERAVYALGPETCRAYCTSSQDSCHQLLGASLRPGLNTTVSIPHSAQPQAPALTILLSLPHWARLLAACPGTQRKKPAA